MDKSRQKIGIKSSILQKKDLKKTEKVVLSSKSQEKIDFYINNKNKFRNKHKLRQHNIFHYINNNNSNSNNCSKDKYKTRTKSRSNPFPKSKKENKLFSSINTEKINNSNDHKRKNKIIIKKSNISNHNAQTPNVQKFKTDINNKNFFRTKEKTIKINLIKLFGNNYISEFIPKDTTNFENIKYIPLDDISSLFDSWQSCSIIYKTFEEKYLKKNNFEIDTKTLEIKTKSHEAVKELYNQKFWILYIEYLIDKNYILTEEQFLSVINEAFSYMEGNDKDIYNDNKGYPCKMLINYFLEKIKKYSPSFQPDGSFDDNDETYINKLSKPASNLINKRKMRNFGCIRKRYKINSDEENINDKNELLNLEL